MAAASTRLHDRHGVTALAIWHSYVLYLVRQGIDLARLQQRVGTLPPSLAQALATFVPSGILPPLTGIDWIHPELAI